MENAVIILAGNAAQHKGSHVEGWVVRRVLRPRKINRRNLFTIENGGNAEIYFSEVKRTISERVRSVDLTSAFRRLLSRFNITT